MVDALPAAHSLATACLQTFTLLLGCHKELPEALQLQVLAALAQQQQQPADQASEVVSHYMQCSVTKRLAAEH
mgnify:CR=1 FL=1